MKQAKVAYSPRRVGGYTGRVREVSKRDEEGEPVEWRVYPVRSWSDRRRQMWLPLREARLWHKLKDWQIVGQREVLDEGRGEDMREGLVEYLGRRRGTFKQRVGKFPARKWACVPPDNEMWLPIEEAEMWDRQSHWRLTRTRRVGDAAEGAPASVHLAAPAAPARHIEEMMDRVGETIERLKEAEEVEFEFCLSQSGVVHKVGCVAWPKHPKATFATFAEAVNHEEYDRVHKACCKEELKASKPQEDEVEGALAQMNALGEAYGIQQAEA